MMLIIVYPGKRNYLAEAQPKKLKELVESWHQYGAETGTVLKDRRTIPVGKK